MSSVSELTKMWEKKCQDDKDYAKATRTSCHGIPSRNLKDIRNMMPKIQEEEIPEKFINNTEGYRISSIVRESNKEMKQNSNVYEQPR